MTQDEQDQYDVVVIGGGAAGLGGALMLARSRRSVAVVDGGQPRNAPAAGVHGYLTRDGMPPAEFVRTGRIEVEGYGGRVLDGQVERVNRNSDGRLVVTLADGRSLSGRRLLIATGLVDELPDVPGVQERWGRDVLHCPYCHGWEVRGRAIAVLGSGPMSVHQALLFRKLSDDVTYLSHSLSPTTEQDEQLRARGIRIIEGTVAGLQVENESLTGVRLADGGVVPCTTLVVARPADPQGRTETPGVWVVGNVTELSAQVGAAAAAGAAAGAAINGDLALEDTRVAVDTLRAYASPSAILAPVAQSVGAP